MRPYRDAVPSRPKAMEIFAAADQDPAAAKPLVQALPRSDIRVLLRPGMRMSRAAESSTAVTEYADIKDGLTSISPLVPLG